MYFLLYRSAKIQICIFAEPYSYLLILAETVSMGTCGNYCDICCGALLFPLYILCRNSDKIYGLSKDQHQYLCLLLLHVIYSPPPLSSYLFTTQHKIHRLDTTKLSIRIHNRFPILLQYKETFTTITTYSIFTFIEHVECIMTIW